MSASSEWRPVFPPPSGQYVPYSLHAAIAREFADHDGTLVDDIPLGPESVGWLRGRLSNSRRDDEERETIEAMLEAIAKHGAIEVNIRR